MPQRVKAFLGLIRPITLVGHFAGTLLIAASLGAHDFGLLAGVLAGVSIASGVLEFVFDSAASVVLAGRPKQRLIIAKYAILAGILVGAVALILASLMPDPHRVLLVSLSPILALAGIHGAMIGGARATRNARFAILMTAARPLMRVFAVVTVVSAGWMTLWTAPFVEVTGIAAATVLGWPIVGSRLATQGSRGDRPPEEVPHVGWQRMLALATTSLSSQATQRLDLVLLPWWIASGNVGRYAIALQVAQAPTVAIAVAAPVLVSRLVASSPQRRASLYREATWASTLLAAAAGLLLVSVVVPLLKVLAADIAPEPQIVALLVTGAMAAVTFGPVGLSLTAANRMQALASGSLMGLGVNVVGNLLLIPIWGEHGAAVATFLSAVAMHAGLAGFVNQSETVPDLWSALRGPIELSILASAAVLVLSTFPGATSNLAGLAMAVPLLMLALRRLSRIYASSEWTAT